MLLSMTGFGEARVQADGMAVAVEVRTINSRYFKVSIRTSEGYAALEAQIEALARDRIRRGTVQINLKVDRERSADDYLIDHRVLEGYRRQLDSIRTAWKIEQPLRLEDLLLLPGVANEQAGHSADAASDWPVIGPVLEQAIEGLERMRAEEGRAMAADLRANCRAIAAALDAIAERAPLVVESYRARLTERLKKTLAEFAVSLDPSDVVREVALFAERSDISEEIVRLRSHVEQFEASMDLPESAGRKLDFLTQEMFREANTIGSKANDVEIAQHVIEVKTAIERIREMVQNVE